MMCGSQFPAPEGEVGCCMASAFTDGDRCDCWQPIIEPLPVTELQEGPMNAPKKACHDCAYRAGSPEREALGGELPDYGPHMPFVCHQGMSKIVAYVHPSGARIEIPGDDYYGISHDTRLWNTDGSPGELCAGWSAVNRIRTATPERPQGITNGAAA